MNTSKSILAAMAIAMTTVACSAQVEVKAPPPPPKEEPVVVEKVEAPAPKYIAISDRIQFEVGRDVLLPQSRLTLDEVAQVLQENQHIDVEIEGHTDATGIWNHNQSLSQRRAEAVRRYLVEKNIAENRLVARGYGAKDPVADNDTVEGREENRRVEFRIIEQS